MHVEIKIETNLIHNYKISDMQESEGVSDIPAERPIVDDGFFSTVPGLNFDVCIDSSLTLTHIYYLEIFHRRVK